MKKNIQFAALASAMMLSFSANASFVNGGFEDGFSGWTTTGHAYLVTMNGNTRQRHSYLDYRGWEGADVWFGNNNAGDGVTYAVFGSNGNESDGSAQTNAWTATNQFVSFKHSGNNTSFLQDNLKAFAAVRDLQGNELARVYATSYNNSQWNTFSIDLAQAGLSYGDQFTFYYEDAYSWSILDAVNQNGAQLDAAPTPVPVPVGLSALALCGLLMSRKRK